MSKRCGMMVDRSEHMVERLIVEVERLGASGYSARDLVVGLLAAAVEVAGTAHLPLSFVTRMAANVVDACEGEICGGNA